MSSRSNSSHLAVELHHGAREPALRWSAFDTYVQSLRGRGRASPASYIVALRSIAKSDTTWTQQIYQLLSSCKLYTIHAAGHMPHVHGLHLDLQLGEKLVAHAHTAHRVQNCSVHLVRAHRPHRALYAATKAVHILRNVACDSQRRL